MAIKNNKTKVASFQKGITFAPGELAEWSIAAVLKTVDPQGSGGSNPSFSASCQSKRMKTTVKLNVDGGFWFLGGAVKRISKGMQEVFFVFCSLS